MVGEFDEGRVDIFSGPSSLGECSGFTVRETGQNFTMGKSHRARGSGMEVCLNEEESIYPSLMKISKRVYLQNYLTSQHVRTVSKVLDICRIATSGPSEKTAFKELRVETSKNEMSKIQNNSYPKLPNYEK